MLKYFTNKQFECRHIFCVFFCFVLFHFFAGAQAQESSGSQIESLQFQIEGQALYIDAQINIDLTPSMRDALEKGVSLYFVVSADVKRTRWYWFDALDAHATKVMRLSYVPLLRQYRVSIGVAHQTFHSLDEALALLGQVSHWQISDDFDADVSGKQTLMFTFELDQKKLPRLFQVGLSVDKDWRLIVHRDLKLVEAF